jgi:hypothetical protein
MRKPWLVFVAGVGLVPALVAGAFAQESGGKSWPKDTTPYSRPAIPEDRVPATSGAGAEGGAGSSANVIGVIDTVVNNTDPALQNTDTFNDGETSIAVNPANPDEIVISAFSGGWGANAPIWHSTDGGQTWTKRFTVPAPPGVTTSGCPCDQVFDYGRNDTLYGSFLLPADIYSGSTLNPASAASWSWWVVSGVAQKTDLVATAADQPWALVNRGTTNGQEDEVYVAYDDFGANPVTVRVSTSINMAPPQFPAGSDKQVGTRASGFYNPGHRLAKDPRNGWIYSLWQNCITNCATIGSNPKTMEYRLSRSVDRGVTWTLNSSSTGIVVATRTARNPTRSSAPSTPCSAASCTPRSIPARGICTMRTEPATPAATTGSRCGGSSTTAPAG